MSPNKASDRVTGHAQDGSNDATGLPVDFNVIPFQDAFILYRPRRHLAFVGNQAMVDYIRRRISDTSCARNKDIERFLETVGFWRPDIPCQPLPYLPNLKPTHAVLLMTNRCNLRCTYCYADGGENQTVQEISWPLAKAVLDTVIDNARTQESKSPALTFHGGGEPTVHWDLLQRAVEYARDRVPGFRVSMSSNGVWSDSQREYICRRFSSVSLSMDGIAKVQNRQRPFPNGADSFPAVMETIAALDSMGMEYGVRLTVLPESVSSLSDSIQWICEHTRAAAIQVEPTFTSSRGLYADLDLSFADAFSQAFMEAWHIGKSAGRNVYYSGARPWVISMAFCLAATEAITVTSDGRLVTCFEVFSEKSPLAGGFTVGRVRDGRVEYDRAALETFLDAQQQRRLECVDCFCYWHCCGDCATRRPGGRNSSEGRCRVTRSITLALLLAYMEEGKGLWIGLRETPEASQVGCDATDAMQTPSDERKAT